MKKNILFLFLILSTILYSQNLGIHFSGIIYDCEENNDWSELKMLLDAGLHPSTTDLGGKTIMQAAISRNSYKAVYLLLTYGYSVRGPVLLDACYNDVLNPAMIELIIANGGDVHYKEDGENALYQLARSKDVMSRYVAEMLIKAGSDVNARNIHTERTVYSEAIKYKNRDVADVVKKYGGHR